MRSWLKHLLSAVVFIGLLQAGVAHSQTTYTDRFAGSVVATGIKQPTKVATTGAISLIGQQTIDGISVLQGDRVLVKNQVDQTTNGIYQVTLAAWTRTQDFSGPSGVVSGQVVLVNNGTQFGMWQLTSADPVCVDDGGGGCPEASDITFAFFRPGEFPVSNNSVISNVSGITALPQGNSLTSILDSVFGSTVGTLIFRNTSHWDVLPQGSANQILTSHGTGVIPTFATNTAIAVPTGSVLMFAANACPAGYLYENGQAVSRTTEATLFGVIGTTYGTGNGTTTYNVPDMRGYFPRGWADNGSIDPGRSFATTEADGIASHSVTITITDPGHSHTTDVSPSGFHASGSGATFATPGGDNTGVSFTGITATGAYSGIGETRPQNLAVLFCIKD